LTDRLALIVFVLKKQQICESEKALFSGLTLKTGFPGPPATRGDWVHTHPLEHSVVTIPT
jgi:hypothetical protein